MLCVGTHVRIKPEAWNRYLSEEKLPETMPPPPPPAQIIARNPEQNIALLSFPLFWWDEEDIEAETVVGDHRSCILCGR